MPEVVRTFLRTELRDERSNSPIKRGNSPRRHLAQEGLEFAVGEFDRVEVGRVFRQVTKFGPRFLDRLPNIGPEMDAAVVHDHDIVALERRNQALLDIGEERSWRP